MSRTFKAVAASLLLVATDAASQEAWPSEGSIDPCHAFTPDADYVETAVVRQHEGGEVTLRAPEQYFEDFWDQAGGYTATSQLFRVEIGTFDPVTRRETGERNKQGIWNWMHFLVGDNVPLPEMARIGADLSALGGSVTAYAIRPGEHGLAWLDSPYASDKPDPRKDVFVDPPDYGRLTTAITCTSPLYPASRYPTCEQAFRAAGLDVQLSYDRTELAHWREFQAQVTAFLTCATSEPS